MTDPQPSNSSKKIILGLAAGGLLLAGAIGVFSVQSSNRIAESSNQSPIASTVDTTEATNSRTSTSSAPSSSEPNDEAKDSSRKNSNASDRTETPTSAKRGSANSSTPRQTSAWSDNPGSYSIDNRGSQSHTGENRQWSSQPTSTTRARSENSSRDDGSTGTASAAAPTAADQQSNSAQSSSTTTAPSSSHSPNKDPYLPPFSRLTENLPEPALTGVPQVPEISNPAEGGVAPFSRQRPTRTWTPTSFVNPKEDEWNWPFGGADTSVPLANSNGNVPNDQASATGSSRKIGVLEPEDSPENAAAPSQEPTDSASHNQSADEQQTSTPAPTDEE